jgi:hypothetical protein
MSRAHSHALLAFLLCSRPSLQVRHCTELRALDLEGCIRVSEECVVWIEDNYPDLEIAGDV